MKYVISKDVEVVVSAVIKRREDEKYTMSIREWKEGII